MKTIYWGRPGGPIVTNQDGPYSPEKVDSAETEQFRARMAAAIEVLAKRSKEQNVIPIATQEPSDIASIILKAKEDLKASEAAK